ncbi:MAG: ATP-binding protein, partial [Methanothrix soehngenii]|nr:ATP-binding protein [Methanothrix soehngenii]
MKRIRALDEETVNKIAAGEVIERPASVVKELVENSIDAGAHKVLIEVRDGGKSFIKVTDDGSGIDPDDLPLAFQKHATSKISGALDLEKIVTLGFR